MAQEPTIVVQKTDGTEVRMTLREFSEYKKAKAAKRSKGNQPRAKETTKKVVVNANSSSSALPPQKVIPKKVESPKSRPSKATNTEIDQLISGIGDNKNQQRTDTPRIEKQKFTQKRNQRITTSRNRKDRGAQFQKPASRPSKKIEATIPKSSVPAVVPKQALANAVPVPDIFVQDRSAAKKPVISQKKQQPKKQQPKILKDTGSSNREASTRVAKDSRTPKKISKRVEAPKQKEYKNQKRENLRPVKNEKRGLSPKVNKPPVSKPPLAPPKISIDSKKPVKKEKIKAPVRSSEPPQPAAPPVSTDPVDVILSEITFKVADDLRVRLYALVQSRVQDIRTDVQLHDYVVRDSRDGGLSVSEEDAAQLLAIVAKHVGTPSPEIPVSNDMPKSPPLSPPPPGLAPAKVSDKSPATAPVSGVSAQTGKPVTAHLELSSITAAPAMSTSGITTPRTATGKKVMHDVTPSIGPARSVGPVDEFAIFTLVDFRRLATGAQDAQKKLMKKIDNLQSESYILYLESIAAWRKSPLYKKYEDIIVKSLVEKKMIPDLLQGSGSGDSLTLDEFKAIVDINGYLSY